MIAQCIMKIRITEYTAILFAFLIGGTALAALPAPRAPLVDRNAFEWTDLHEGDVREIPDPYVEAHLRLRLIQRAKRTIDISQYLQTDDREVAMPLMTALREAANRGVQVRFMITGTPETKLDFMDRFRKHLIGVSTRAPIECLYFDDRGPWSFFDEIHEKLLVVDGQIVVTGGRAYGEDFLHWLDDGFIARGALAAQAQVVYDRIWNFVTRQEAPRTTPALALGASTPGYEHFKMPPSMALSPERQRTARDIFKWLDEPVHEDSPVTGRARMLHFDMFQQRWMNHFPRTLRQRAQQLEDPILNELVERISRTETRRVLISSMSLIESPQLKSALVDAALRGVDVRLLTNSKDSDAAAAPLGINWTISLPDMLELAQAGVKIFSFEAKPSVHPWKYLHKKMAIVDDAALVGSHNFNYPSSLYNDEADFEIEDAGFARTARERLETQIALAARPLEASELKWHLNHRGPPIVRNLEWWLGQKMLPLF